ncbi:MAG: hypothetical protein WKG32_09795 [Gemmatimonadaceae bacterium]
MKRPVLLGALAMCAAWAMLATAAPHAARAQATTTPPPAAATMVPAPRPADVATIDAVIAALYDVISGPAGQKRDWDRMRSLFYPGAKLVPTGKRPTGEVAARLLTLEEYITRSGPQLENGGFFEKEVSRELVQYGNIAHAFSTYESRGKADDAKPFARGINSIQLVNDGTRWWVLNVFWQAETPGTPLPGKYLPGKKG